MSFLAVPNELVPVAGSILGASGAETIKKIQDTYLEKSRLKIPLIFMADVIVMALGESAEMSKEAANRTDKRQVK